MTEYKTVFLPTLEKVLAETHSDLVSVENKIRKVIQYWRFF